ncbi:unnamed protein product [Rhizoctonia solani]|uniref:Uncharacterized protein n=1 Tax=Rhizoctonia solani TaxID=456999 RepID=A0A8H2XJ66_9AGAM|nr:unnamed protein product [Rhizoctonia solani]
MRFNISSFFTLAIAATAAVAQPAKRAPLSPNPPHALNKHVDLTALPPVDVSPITNAKRFARGLPPLPVKRRPHRGGPHKDGAYHQEGTRVEAVPRAEPSSTPSTNTKCNILAKAGDTTLGYISATFNDFGEYGTPQGSQAGALEVSFPEGSTSQVGFVAANAPDAINSFPYLSAAVGYMSEGDDLGSGSSNYVAITGNSGPMPAGSPPSNSTSNSYSTRTELAANSETAIWTYDPSTQNIQAVWVNTDGKSVPTTFVYFVDTETENGGGNTFLATADLGAFQGLFDCTDTCRAVTFTCVPPA